MKKDDAIRKEFLESDIFKKYSQYGDKQMTYWAVRRLGLKKGDAYFKRAVSKGGKIGGKRTWKKNLKTDDSNVQRERGRKGGKVLVKSEKFKDVLSAGAEWRRLNPGQVRELGKRGGAAARREQNRRAVTCPVCGKTGKNLGSFHRYHFKNCGIKQNPFGHLTHEQRSLNVKKGRVKQQKNEALEQTIKVYMFVLEKGYDVIKFNSFAREVKSAGIVNTNLFAVVNNKYLNL